MMRYILTVLFVASLTTAQGAPYLSASGGASFLEIEARDSNESEHMDDGYVGELAIGLAYRPEDCDTSLLRAEVAYSHQRAKADIQGDPDVKTSGIMFNGYIDLYNDSIIEPFVLFGIGRADVDSGSYDKSLFAYQLGTGVGISYTKNIIFDLKYRHFKVLDDDNGLRLHMHQVQAGVRYMF